MSRLKPAILLLVGVLAGSLAWTAAASAGKAKQAKRIVVTVGVMDDLTGGSAASTGIEHVRADVYAAKLINKTDPHVFIKLIVKDAASSPSGAVSALQSLLSNPDVDVITGGDLGPECLAWQPLLKADGRPAVLQQCASITGRGGNVFSLAPPRGKLAANLVTKVLAKRRVKTAALIWHQNPVLMGDAQGFRDGMSQAGIKLVADEGTSQTTTDYSAQETAVLSKNPDAIGLACLPPPSGQIVSDLRARGFKGLIFGQQAMDSAPFRATAGANAAGSLIFTFWDIAVPSTVDKTFINGYERNYPSSPPPDVFGAQSWDALHVIAQAVEKAGSTDRTKLVKVLSTTHFSGAEDGNFTFGSDGYASLNGYVIQMTAKGSKVVWP